MWQEGLDAQAHGLQLFEGDVAFRILPGPEAPGLQEGIVIQDSTPRERGRVRVEEGSLHELEDASAILLLWDSDPPTQVPGELLGELDPTTRRPKLLLRPAQDVVELPQEEAGGGNC